MSDLIVLLIFCLFSTFYINGVIKKLKYLDILLVMHLSIFMISLDLLILPP